MTKQHQLAIRRQRPRWIIVLGSARANGERLLREFIAGGRRFPEAIVALPGAVAWLSGDMSPDAVAAQVYARHTVHVVPIDALRDSLGDLEAAREDRPLLLIRQWPTGRIDQARMIATSAELGQYLTNEQATLVLAGVTAEESADVALLIEALEDSDPFLPRVTVDSAIEAPEAEYHDADAFLADIPPPSTGTELLVGDSGLRVPLHEICTDPSLRLDRFWRIVTAKAVEPDRSPNAVQRAYDALWWLDERRFAPSIDEDHLEWWALDERAGIAFRRQALARVTRSALSLLPAYRPREETLEVTVEPGAGTTVFLHQVALAAARAGYPTFILRALARDFSANAMKDFLLALENAAIPHAQRQQVDFSMPPALVVLDTQHSSPAIDDSLDELVNRFRANVAILRAVAPQPARALQLTQSLDPNELAAVPRWLGSLIDQGITLAPLRDVSDLDDWVRRIHGAANDSHHGFFRLLNHALRATNEAGAPGLVANALRVRLDRLKDDLAAGGDRAPIAARELATVIELAKLRRLADSSPLQVPVSALRSAARAAEDLATAVSAPDAIASPAKATPEQVAAFKRRAFRATALAPTGIAAFYTFLTDQDFDARWFARVDTIERDDRSSLGADAVMMDFDVEVLSAFAAVVGETDDTALRALLLGAAGIEPDELPKLTRSAGDLFLVRRILRVLEASDAAGERDFCERLSEAFLRGSDDRAEWINGSQEPRVQVFQSINRGIINASRVLLHHQAIVLRRSTWSRHLTDAQKIERLEKAVRNLEQANDLPWTTGRRDDSPTHLLTTMGLCLRSLERLKGDLGYRARAEDTLRRALKASRGLNPTPHTRLALAEILIENLDARPEGAEDAADREKWLEFDAQQALEAAALLATYQRGDGHRRWPSARQRLLGILPQLLGELSSVASMRSIAAWLAAERDFLALFTTDGATTEGTDALVAKLEDLLPLARPSVVNLLRERTASLLVTLQENELNWRREREAKIDELYQAVCEGRLAALPTIALYRWAVAKFQLGQYSPGSAMFRELRERRDARHLVVEEVLVRDPDGKPATFSARVERTDGDQLYLTIEQAGRTLFRARGRADQLSAQHRGNAVQGVVVRLRRLGPIAVPPRFVRGARGQR